MPLDQVSLLSKQTVRLPDTFGHTIQAITVDRLVNLTILYNRSEWNNIYFIWLNSYFITLYFMQLV